jgi:hypothetical protein
MNPNKQTLYLFISHISGNITRIGSIEVPMDRAHPDEERVKFPQIAIDFNEYGWSSNRENAKKEALKGPDR